MIRSRSPILRQGIQAAAPLAVLVAIYLLLAGHNRPGGGFAAGLVLGAVVALRTVAGLARPRRAVPLLAFGVGLAGLVGLAPVVGGEVLLDQVVVEVEAPVLGRIKSGSSLLFDIGVTAVVVGLVAAVLEGLGADELSGPSQPAAGDGGGP